jgi:hypothetical protein
MRTRNVDSESKGGGNRTKKRALPQISGQTIGTNVEDGRIWHRKICEAWVLAVCTHSPPSTPNEMREQGGSASIKYERRAVKEK